MLDRISLILYMVAALFLILYMFFRGEMPGIVLEYFKFIVLGLAVLIGITELLKIKYKGRR